MIEANDKVDEMVIKEADEGRGEELFPLSIEGKRRSRRGVEGRMREKAHCIDDYLHQLFYSSSLIYLPFEYPSL